MTTLWIGDLCQTWGEAQLNALFADARIYFRSNFLLAGFLHSKLIVNRETGCSAGYGFLEFSSHEYAELALREYNAGFAQVFRLNWGAPGLKLNQPEVSLFIGDLASSINDVLLFSAFSEHYPSTLNAKVMIDPVTRCSRGYGFVKFGDYMEAERAIVEMNGKSLYGRQIRVSTAQKRCNGQINGNNFGNGIYMMSCGDLDSNNNNMMMMNSNYNNYTNQQILSPSTPSSITSLSSPSHLQQQQNIIYCNNNNNNNNNNGLYYMDDNNNNYNNNYVSLSSPSISTNSNNNTVEGSINSRSESNSSPSTTSTTSSITDNNNNNNNISGRNYDCYEVELPNIQQQQQQHMMQNQQYYREYQYLEQQQQQQNYQQGQGEEGESSSNNNNNNNQMLWNNYYEYNNRMMEHNHHHHHQQQQQQQSPHHTPLYQRKPNDSNVFNDVNNLESI